VAKIYESAIELEKNSAQALVEVLHLDSKKNIFNSTCSNKIKVTTSN
jgi:hypothetical protein